MSWGAQLPLGRVKTRRKGQVLPRWGFGRCSGTIILQQKLLRAGAFCPELDNVRCGWREPRLWVFGGRSRADQLSFGKGFRHGGEGKTPPSLPSLGTMLISGGRAFLLRFFQAVATLPAFLSGTDVIFP